MYQLRCQSGAGNAKTIHHLQRLRRARMSQWKMLRLHMRLGRMGMCKM